MLWFGNSSFFHVLSTCVVMAFEESFGGSQRVGFVLCVMASCDVDMFHGAAEGMDRKSSGVRGATS